MGDASSSRRDFLRGSGGALAATWLGVHWPALAAIAQHSHEVASGAIDHTFKVLTPAQARDVEAIASQVIPSGDTPGAREAGVVYFVDHVLAGIFEGMRPDFVAGLGGFQQAWADAHPGSGAFADATPEVQLEHLKRVEDTPFFQGMRFLSITGLLSNPSYGGNEQKLGWKLVGFVDQHAWQPPFGHYDAEYAGFVPYAREPRT